MASVVRAVVVAPLALVVFVAAGAAVAFLVLLVRPTLHHVTKLHDRRVLMATQEGFGVLVGVRVLVEDGCLPACGDYPFPES